MRIRFFTSSILLAVLLFGCAYTSKSQLMGLGTSFHYGRAAVSQQWSPNAARRYTGFGVFFEHPGFISNFKHYLGTNQIPYVAFTDTIGMAYTRIQTGLIYRLEWKYWLSNAMRAGSIHGIKCAHKMKIREDYAFKLYTVLGLDNSVLFKQGDSGNRFSRNYVLSGVAGIGANLLKISGAVMFVELKGFRQLTPLFRDGPEQQFRGFGFDVTLGFKGILESSKPSW